MPTGSDVGSNEVRNSDNGCLWLIGKEKGMGWEGIDLTKWGDEAKCNEK